MRLASIPKDQDATHGKMYYIKSMKEKMLLKLDFPFTGFLEGNLLEKFGKVDMFPQFPNIL
jgi:hypothetical protein